MSSGKDAKSPETGADALANWIRLIAALLVAGLVLGYALLLPLGIDWVPVTVGDNATDHSESVSVAVDSRDLVHVSYSTVKGLYHSYGEQGSWKTETVWTYGADFSTIELDSQDNAHIAFTRSWSLPMAGLSYATNKNGNWEVSTVDPNVTYWPCSMAVDSEANPHILYCKNSSLIHTTLNQGVWVKEVIFSYEESEFNKWAFNSDAVFDDQGILHVAFNEGHSIYYAEALSNGSWDVELVYYADGHGLGEDVSVALDPYQAVHLCYIGNPPGEYNDSRRLVYATKADGTWGFENISTGGDRWFTFCSMAFSRDGMPHIAWGDVKDDQFRTNHAWKPANQWLTENIVAGGDLRIGRDALSLDSSGDCYVSLELTSKIYPSYYTNHLPRYHDRFVIQWGDIISIVGLMVLVTIVAAAVVVSSIYRIRRSR